MENETKAEKPVLTFEQKIEKIVKREREIALKPPREGRLPDKAIWVYFVVSSESGRRKGERFLRPPEIHFSSDDIDLVCKELKTRLLNKEDPGRTFLQRRAAIDIGGRLYIINLNAVRAFVSGDKSKESVQRSADVTETDET